MTFVAAYLALGLVSGFIAGLLGVGGGLVIVPVLSWIYSQEGFPAQYNIHMALGTSLSVIVLTSISSLRAHHGHGAVRWQAVRRITPGILLGTLAGAFAAARLPDLGLRWFFTLFLYYAAIQMLLALNPEARRELPGWPGMTVAGGVIGLISSWVGIGGGTLSVPFLNWCNVRLQEAIGTSAAIGFPIAVSGAAGYAMAGWGADGLPPWSLGFIYLPATAIVALVSVLSAPWGARLTHRLPAGKLKRIFSGLLLFMAVRMTYGLLTH
jgi:uncharacterized membrane protein YfcA